MVLLLVNLRNDLLRLDIYQIYRNKKIVHEVSVKIKNINDKTLQLKIENVSKEILIDKNLTFKPDVSIEEKLNRILRDDVLIKYDFDYTVCKIKDGGNQYHDITLSHSNTLARLRKINTSPQQRLQLSIASYLANCYKNAKHYLCFDSGFFQSVVHSVQENFPFEPNTEFGLYFSSISTKLIRYSPKPKKTWLFVVIEPQYAIMSVVKKQKCISSSKITLNIMEDNKENKANLIKLAGALAQALTIINEVYGIVISGELGCSNVKVRKMVFKQLAWSGISVSPKSASYLMSKKTSTLPLLCIKGSKNEAIIAQFSERL